MKTRGNRYKLFQDAFHLDVRNVLLTVRTISLWNNLPRVVIESLSLKGFKMWLDGVLDNLI